MQQPSDLHRKLDILMSLAEHDKETEPGIRAPLPPRLRNASAAGALRPLNLRSVRMGTGPVMSLLRILMTNACSFNCHYCPMRRDREMPRALLKPEELVRIFLGARARGWCQGLFITTGIPARPAAVMDDLIEVLELLRVKHRFQGYIHTKIVPGAEEAQVARLTELATRVSVNLEAPCGDNLTRIAPEKRFATTLANLEQARARIVEARLAQGNGRPRDPLRPQGAAGITTQFVVGATSDPDRTFVDTLVSLYARGGVHHAQFSAFRPIRDTPMEQTRATLAVREHRLYQADHLIRDYGFGAGEIVYDDSGNLPLGRDPKVAAALAHPERFPLDVLVASRGELVRVPGIGPATARRIVEERRSTTIRGAGDLRRLGVIVDRAAGFLSIRGRRLRTDRWAEQLGFWAPEDDVGAAHIRYEFSPGTFR